MEKVPRSLGGKWRSSALSDENGCYRLDELRSGGFWLAARYLAWGGCLQTYEVRAMAEGYISGRITLPPFSENDLNQARALIEFFNETSERHAYRLAKGLREAPLPETKGNAFTGVDLLLVGKTKLAGRILNSRGKQALALAEQASIRMVAATIPRARS